MIAKFNRAPLPFQGQKRNFIKQFNELIKDEFCRYRNGVFIDAFGGSGLLSHNIKQIYPNARVIYNDYDGYCERLEHIEETNEIQILDDFKNKDFYIDWLTFSSVLFCGGSYAHNETEFKKEKRFFSRANGSVPQYNAKGYLEGVEIVHKDAMELIKEFDRQDVVLVLDPPYLQTDKAGYKCFWGLRDFLKLIRLVREPFIFFSSENSDILPYIDDRVENDGCEIFKDYKIKQASLSNGAKTKPDYMIYKSGIRSLF